ncbi:Cyclin, C-terminal domain [Dillenia turbinata]|uniref:Cyclin, C-terminal domain n=1 Tax=Dillenia turbinata TaxID=194707 RepID=A0AAN8VZF6_9MAGN
MESLLCDEVWLSSPTNLISYDRKHGMHPNPDSQIISTMFHTTIEDCQYALSISLEKELSYIPKPGYSEFLRSSSNMKVARYKAIQWLIKLQSRLNLSCGIIFDAANYFDRFVSMNQGREWKEWIIELLSIACFYVASKFSETDIPTLHEIQMEGMDYSFESATIQQMELILLQELGWHLRCTTSYSIVELLIWNLDSVKPQFQYSLRTRIFQLLLGALSDVRFVDFRPCTIAISALKCTLEELVASSANEHLMRILGLIPEDQKEDVAKCHKIMEAQSMDPIICKDLIASGHSFWGPSSPVTVLTAERIDIYDCHVDLSAFRKSDHVNVLSGEKRKRED